jgi:hypothetical protein
MPFPAHLLFASFKKISTSIRYEDVLGSDYQKVLDNLTYWARGIEKKGKEKLDSHFS